MYFNYCMYLTLHVELANSPLYNAGVFLKSLLVNKKTKWAVT
jgi:hypothetical protein